MNIFIFQWLFLLLLFLLLDDHVIIFNRRFKFSFPLLVRYFIFLHNIVIKYIYFLHFKNLIYKKEFVWITSRFYLTFIISGKIHLSHTQEELKYRNIKTSEQWPGHLNEWTIPINRGLSSMFATACYCNCFFFFDAFIELKSKADLTEPVYQIQFSADPNSSGAVAFSAEAQPYRARSLLSSAYHQVAYVKII